MVGWLLTGRASVKRDRFHSDESTSHVRCVAPSDVRGLAPEVNSLVGAADLESSMESSSSMLILQQAEERLDLRVGRVTNPRIRNERLAEMICFWCFRFLRHTPIHRFTIEMYDWVTKYF